MANKAALQKLRRVSNTFAGRREVPRVPDAFGGRPKLPRVSDAFVEVSDEELVAVIGHQLQVRPKLAPARAQVVERLREALTSAERRNDNFGPITSEAATGRDIDDFVNGLETIGAKPAPPAAARTEREIVAEAREAILEQEMLSPDALFRLLAPRKIEEPKTTARRERPGVRTVRELERSGVLLALRPNKSKLYPAFQIDRKHRRVYTEVGEVNRRLGAAKDPWGVASWWISPHERIGAAPLSLVGTAKSHQLMALVESLLDDGY